jgi:hypothetical protein
MPGCRWGDDRAPRESDWAKRLRGLDSAEQVQRLDAVLVGFHLNVQHQVARRIARCWDNDIEGRPPKGARSGSGAPDLRKPRLKSTRFADRLGPLCSAPISHRGTNLNPLQDPGFLSLRTGSVS